MCHLLPVNTKLNFMDEKEIEEKVKESINCIFKKVSDRNDLSYLEKLKNTTTYEHILMVTEYIIENVMNDVLQYKKTSEFLESNISYNLGRYYMSVYFHEFVIIQPCSNKCFDEFKPPEKGLFLNNRKINLFEDKLCENCKMVKTHHMNSGFVLRVVNGELEDLKFFYDALVSTITTFIRGIEFDFDIIDHQKSIANQKRDMQLLNMSLQKSDEIKHWHIKQQFVDFCNKSIASQNKKFDEKWCK